MFETYRMLGEQREAELLREARRLQAGTSVRLGARRHGAYLDSSFALARRAMGKMAWLTGFVRRPSSILIQSPGRPPSETNDSGLAVDNCRLRGSGSRPRTRGFEGRLTSYVVQAVAWAMISGARVFISGARVFSNELLGTRQ
jgi:hypothetical protein